MLDQRRRGFAGGIRRKYDESDTGGTPLLVPAVLLALLINGGAHRAVRAPALALPF